MDQARLRRIDQDAPGRADEIPGSDVPHLPFPAIHGKFDGVAIRAVEGLVLMEKRLDDILARRDLGEGIDGKTEDRGVENGFFARF